MKRVLLAGFAGLLAACTGVDATMTPYVDAPHFSPTDPLSVAILRSAPEPPYERLGEIVVNAAIEPTPTTAEIEDKLRREAAKLGAEAVVVVYDGTQAVAADLAGWGPSVQIVTGRKLLAIAIRYP